MEPRSNTKTEQCERILQELGFRGCRVWEHGAVARLEIAPEEQPRMRGPELWDEIVRRIRAAGFAHVTLDLPGAPAEPCAQEPADTEGPPS